MRWLRLLLIISSPLLVLSQTRWSRQVGGTSQPISRERRQFNSGDWIPLAQPCPTCRPLTDNTDLGTQKINDIGLVPPKPPTVTRQIHQTAFFPNQVQDDAASLLQAPPPPTFHHHRANPFLSGQNLIQFPRQNVFTAPQHHHPHYVPQTFVTDFQQPYLLQQQPNFVLPQQQQPLQPQQPQQPLQQQPLHQQPPQLVKQQEIKKPEPAKKPQNVQIEQNTRDLPPPPPPPQVLGFPFLTQPEQLIQINNQFLPQQNLSLSGLPELQIPGLEKEEIQLLYVPVETLKQRGHLIENKQRPLQQASVVHHPLTQTTHQPHGGHFVTHGLPQQPVTTTTTTTTTTQTPPPSSTTEQLVEIQPRPQQQFISQPYKDDLRLVHDNFLQPPPQTQFFPPQPQQAPQQEFFTHHQQPPQVLPQVPPQQEFFTRHQQPPQVQPQAPPQQEFFTRHQQPPQVQPQAPPQPEFFNHHQQPPQQHQQILFHNQQVQLQQQKQELTQQHVERPKFSPQPPVEHVTEQLTTLAPHQPPLSVYMGGVIDGHGKVLDVLKALKDARTIPVLDGFTRNSPRVFVGPANLNPPHGYSKFELPYLSSLDNNRVERKVEKLPFFVAPLNFNPPPGYSKIPFPAPHVGSVVVASESAMRAALLHDKAAGTTVPSISDTVLPSNLPQVSAELPSLINDLEISKTPFRQETTTPPLPETTTPYHARQRPRRPNNVYRPPGRRPIPHARLRTEEKEEDVTETTEKQTTPFQYPKRSTLSRRQRLKTTTETTFEQTEGPVYESTHVTPQTPTEAPQTQRVDSYGDQYLREVVHPVQQQQEPQYPVQYQHNYQPEPVEVGVEQVLPAVENNGDSGYQPPPPLPEQVQHSTPTEQPQTPTHFFDHSVPSSTPNYIEQTETTTESAKITKYTTQEPTRKLSSRYNGVPNVPGVKSYPNPSAVKVKSAIRSRTRGNTNYYTSKRTTEQTPSTSAYEEPENYPQPIQQEVPKIDSLEQEEVEVANVDVEKTDAELTTTVRAKNKKFEHFNRRKPYTRATTESTTTSTSRTTTLRSLRKSPTDRRRQRRPSTTSEPEESSPETRHRGNYSPTGVSNDVYEDGQSRYDQKTRSRIYRKKQPAAETTTQHSTFQTRKDDLDLVDDSASSQNRVEVKSEKYPEWNPEESVKDVSDIEFTTLTSNREEQVEEYEEEKKKNVDTKKATDPEEDKKTNRRRIRVRVNKRPHDNFETAESQNVGTVANILVPPTPSKPAEPDIYQFSKSIEGYDFSKADKFIGTKNAVYVRNITSQVLENTLSFSSPGLDDRDASKEVTKVTIAKENSKEDFSETTTAITPEETTTEFVDEVTTEQEPVTEQITTTTTALPTATVPTTSQIVKTSTTTQVSHETEICYKGKCIKTDPANSERDLKKLVSSTNDEVRL